MSTRWTGRWRRGGDLVLRLVEFAREESLFSGGEKILVAVSGGGDSVALLLALDRAARADLLSLEPVAAHFDHRMRPGSEEDRVFIEELAARLGRRLIAGNAESGALRGEADAREARHEFLRRAAREAGATTIAFGHQADDQAETVLHRALRGTGIFGLAGIHPVYETEGFRLVRPLLFATRAEIRAWLSAEGERWREDPTNEDRHKARAWLRHEFFAGLPPALYPVGSKNISALARKAWETTRYLMKEAERRLAELAIEPPPEGSVMGRLWPPRLVGEGWTTLDRAGYLALEPALVHPLLALALARAGGSPPSELFQKKVDRALSRGVGADLPGGVKLLLEDAWFHLVARPFPEDPIERFGFEPRAFVAGDDVLLERLGLVLECRAETPPGPLDRGPLAAVIDPGPAPGHLELRPRKPGDRYRPLGAPGAKALAEALSDKKIPHPVRDVLPVVTLDDRPVWAAGLPPDESVRVKPETRTALALRLRAFSSA